MSSDDIPRRPPRATYEEDDDDDDDFEDLGSDTRTSANVAAKRSKPELHAKGSYERRRTNGTDSGYASRADTVGSGSPHRRERRAAELKIDTAFQERERQPYHYTAAKTDPRQPATRPATESTASKAADAKKYYKHRDGECWVCDKYGKHIDPPQGTPVPISPTMARRPQAADDYAAAPTAAAQPRPRRTSSHREARPVSMLASMAPTVLYETKTLPSTFTHESPSYATASWQTTTTPMTVQYAPFTPVTYTQYPVNAAPPVVTAVETQRSYFHPLPPPAKTRPAEPRRRATTYDQSERPLVQQSKSSAARLRDEKDTAYDRRPPLQSRRSSQDRDRDRDRDRDQDQDRRAMPPPPRPQQEQILLARRPSMKKAATSTATPASHRRSQSYDVDRDEFPRLEVIRERKAEVSLPPTSYRGPAAAAAERPPNRKSVSYEHPKHAVEVAARTTTAADLPSRRLSETAPVERYEAEAEAYQRRRGASDTYDLRAQNLTAEALRKVPKARALDTRSETNSSQKSRNSSSKGSSGAKTGQSASDITMRINGIAVGIPADSGQRITIQSKGVNISVGGKGRSGDKEYPGSRNGRAPSLASRTSKTSSGRDKERRADREDERRAAREDERPPLDRAGRPSQTLSRYSARHDEEPLGFGA